MPASKAYSNFVLAMLLLVYLFSLIDRQILAVLIEPMRHDLHLSDTQLGMLSGLAFGLIYAVSAVPLARLADRSSRRTLIAVCLAGWSVATALCGFAQSFVHLFLARVGVGIGEAGASPSSQSLIADYFPPERRATALGIYSMGIFVGSGLGLAIGGYLASLYGWRGAFIAVAIPGFVLAVIFRLTVREPLRGQADGSPASSAEIPAFGASLRIFVNNKPLLAAAFALGFSVYSVQSLLNWLPAFLTRVHGMTPAEAGGAVGPIVAIAGTIGVVAGGAIADWVSRADQRNSPRLMALVSCLIVPAGAVALLADTQTVLFAGLALCFFLTAFVAGPTFALIQNTSPIELRSFSAAMVGLIAVIIGNAMGPFLTGVLSDVFANAGADQPLRWSLISAICANGVAAAAYLLAASRMRPLEM